MGCCWIVRLAWTLHRRRCACAGQSIPLIVFAWAVIDFVGGVADLDAGVVRAIGRAETAV